ncbi:MAG: hypothetical protein PHN18_12970 [Sulfurospirillaceae bacterium]|jgi:TPR repeat protein|nr:hypothetical protein [Sulfurospirillaceae bacterium]MDD2827774.1 hypothetical protein [Sulfurospirillaceae bacterium]
MFRLFSFFLIVIVYAYSSDNNLREGILEYNQKSYAKAKISFEQAIKQDESANAAYMLGKMYLYGEGVHVDTIKAIELFEFAREYGNIPAGCYLSEAYMNAHTNTSYIADGLMKGLRLKIPHCQKILQRYFSYKF